MDSILGHRGTPRKREGEVDTERTTSDFHITRLLEKETNLQSPAKAGHFTKSPPPSQ